MHESRDITSNSLAGGADGSGVAGESGCGARISVALKFSGLRIGSIECVAEGASTAKAAAAALAAAVEGLEWRDAARLGTDELIRAAKEAGKGARQLCPPERAAEFALDALHSAFEDALGRGRFPLKEGESECSGEVVLVAMSGGVDSSTACLLEQRAGRQVIGITLRLWSDPSVPDAGASCCSPAAIRDARNVCHGLGIPHLTYDCTALFELEVVNYFTTEYSRGRTPNPCTHCNSSFRFPLLLRLADSLGAGKVATGHYVRLRDEGRHAPLLLRGRDRRKDQSYVLWGISKAILPRLEFPLGDMLKGETRKLAAAAGLAVYERPESQEVCFIPDDDYRRFLRSRIADLPGEGDIVDSGGRVIGHHESITDYTVGQRRGLGVSAPEPLYVISTDLENATVVAGTRDELAVDVVTLEAINLFVPREQVSSCCAQLRYNSAALPSQIEWNGSDERGYKARLLLDEPAYGVAPGQSAVLYRDDIVLAGGIITAAGS